METSGSSWEYIDLLNADHIGGEKGEVCVHFLLFPFCLLLCPAGANSIDDENRHLIVIKDIMGIMQATLSILS